ncbi:MAG TPA: hypothetical protein V6C63_07145 [Allocoleopsis sp.]
MIAEQIDPFALPCRLVYRNGKGSNRPKFPRVWRGVYFFLRDRLMTG